MAARGRAANIRATATNSIPSLMAGFKTHITVSSLLGVGYGGAAYWMYGVPWPTCRVGRRSVRRLGHVARHRQRLGHAVARERGLCRGGGADDAAAPLSADGACRTSRSFWPRRRSICRSASAVLAVEALYGSPGHVPQSAGGRWSLARLPSCWPRATSAAAALQGRGGRASAICRTCCWTKSTASSGITAGCG